MYAIFDQLFPRQQGVRWSASRRAEKFRRQIEAG
jgi:hypothetical protein